MDKKQAVGALQKIREKGRKQREKIKQIIVRRKDDFLTALEKNWRDGLFKPLTGILYFLGIRANHISYVGFILIAAAIWMYFKNYAFQWQFLSLILAGLSDMIDGPLARNNKNVTVSGTWLDHTRDGFLMAWATYLIYQFNLLSLEVVLIILVLQAVFLWILLKDFLIRYLKGAPKKEEEILIKNFSLDNLQASIIGRTQFFCWAISYFLLFAFLLKPLPILITVGHVFIFLTIIFSALNILEAYRKSSL